MDPSIVCKVFFGLGTAVDVGGTLIPSFRQNIMNYGPRRITPQQSTRHEKDNTQDILTNVFEGIASLQVPHTWFTHYYTVSIASSIFWAHQICTQGPAFRFVWSHSDPTSSSMTGNQVFLAWLLMTLQGARRLYESITQAKSSNSQMWVGLWAIGIAYYIVMGMSVWIEGIPILSQKGGILAAVEFSHPSIKTVVAVPLFLVSSVAQHHCHKHLSSLKKYTLPQDSLFRYIVCPHYTSECFIYLAIAIVAAPRGSVLNGTVLAGIAFVLSNLAVTADSTKKWYEEKFGREKLIGRWRMMPFVY